MIRDRRIRSHLRGAVLLLAAPMLLGAAAHITPVVVLHKQADVIKSSLPSAQSFFVRNVQIGRDDLTRIKQLGKFTPEEDHYQFYYGKDAGGQVAGVVFFAQQNTQHGPMEVGVAVDPSGTIISAVVTKATVETKPWVEKAIRAHLMDGFAGMHPGDDVEHALDTVSKAELGSMPYFSAEVLTQAVKRGLVLYQVLYQR